MPRRAASAQPRVKLTLPPTFARYLLVPRLGSFVEQHPDIAVEIYLSVPLYDLALAESDLEVRFGPGKYPNLQCEKLFSEPTFAVASPEYLKKVDPITSPEDLQNVTLLRSALEPWQPWFEAAGLDWAEPSTGLRVDDLGLLLEMVKHGHGVGLTREHFAREMLVRGEIVRLFDMKTATPPHAYYLVYEKQVTERPEVVTSGFGELVGTDAARILSRTTALLTDNALYQERSSGQNPFGDGRAAFRIAEVVDMLLRHPQERSGPRRLDHSQVNATLERLASVS
jgi:DNA-binding transcriptional LysR family regulator